MKTKLLGHLDQLMRTLDGRRRSRPGATFHITIGFTMKVSQSLLVAVICMLAGAGMAFGDPVYSNYRAGNGYGPGGASTIQNGCGFGPNLEQASAFTVPAGFDYNLTEIDLTGRIWNPSCPDRAIVELWSDASGVPGAPLVIIPTLSPALILSSMPVFYRATPSGGNTTLAQNTTYWVVVSAPSPSVSMFWTQNGVFARGPHAERVPNGAWSLVGASDLPGAFRIVGTPVTAQPVNPSYSSYTAPSGGGPATILLEVVCPTGPPSNPFTMPVNASIPPNQSPAQVCQILADAVNDCGINACPCWGGAACPSTAPYGFHADCSGSVLRITNSTAGLCSGAFVCVDHADGLTKYAGKKQLEGLSSTIAMEIRGIATGVARDSTASIDVNVTRTLRSGPSASPPPVIQGQVILARGMEAGQIRQSLAAALSSQGDTGVVVEGNRLIFSPPGPGGDYDIAFQVNDTGLEYAFSPPFSYSFFDYVARFATNPTPTLTPTPPPTPTPTVCKWGWIILILALVAIGIIFILRSKKRV